MRAVGRFVHFLLTTSGLTALICLAASAFFAGVSYKYWNKLQATPDKPVSMSLEQAAEEVTNGHEPWASLENGKWECTSILHYTLSLNKVEGAITDVAFTNDAQTIVLFAWFSGEVACEELPALPLAGEVTPLHGVDRETVINQGQLAKYPNASAFLQICTGCTPETTKITVVFFAVLAILVLAAALVPIGVAQVRKSYRRQNARGAGA